MLLDRHVCLNVHAYSCRMRKKPHWFDRQGYANFKDAYNEKAELFNLVIFLRCLFQVHICFIGKIVEFSPMPYIKRFIIVGSFFWISKFQNYEDIHENVRNTICRYIFRLIVQILNVFVRGKNQVWQTVLLINVKWQWWCNFED